MNEEQRAAVVRLRNLGWGYKRIAVALDVSRDEVRNYCVAKGLNECAKDSAKEEKKELVAELKKKEVEVQSLFWDKAQGEIGHEYQFNFTVTILRGNRMECKIIEKPAFNFAGVSKRVLMQFEGVNDEIVKLAQSITPKQREELHRLQNIEPHEVVNVS